MHKVVHENLRAAIGLTSTLSNLNYKMTLFVTDKRTIQ